MIFYPLYIMDLCMLHLQLTPKWQGAKLNTMKKDLGASFFAIEFGDVRHEKGIDDSIFIPSDGRSRGTEVT